jgi:hypothetical protein
VLVLLLQKAGRTSGVVSWRNLKENDSARRGETRFSHGNKCKKTTSLPHVWSTTPRLFHDDVLSYKWLLCQVLEYMELYTHASYTHLWRLSWDIGEALVLSKPSHIFSVPVFETVPVTYIAMLGLGLLLHKEVTKWIYNLSTDLQNRISKFAPPSKLTGGNASDVFGRHPVRTPAGTSTPSLDAECNFAIDNNVVK